MPYLWGSPEIPVVALTHFSKPSAYVTVAQIEVNEGGDVYIRAYRQSPKLSISKGKTSRIDVGSFLGRVESLETKNG